VIRLEPGDVAGDAVGGQCFAKAHEGVHFMQIAADRLAHHLEPVDQAVRRIREQASLAVAGAPDQLVEQGVAFGVAVADHRGDQVGERAGQHHRRGVAFGIGAEQVAARGGVPHHAIRRRIGREQAADRAAKPVLIRAGRERDACGQSNRLNCTGGAIRRRRRSSRSVRCVGR
jgi:hypothetical protein